MRRAIVPSYLLVMCFYLMLSWSTTLGMASIAVIGSHAAGSVLWVFSTVLLQMSVPDRFRGRVFSAELALLMIVNAASSYVCGLALDVWGLSPFLLTRVLGVLFLLPAIGWLAIERWHLKADRVQIGASTSSGRGTAGSGLGIRDRLEPAQPAQSTGVRLPVRRAGSAAL